MDCGGALGGDEAVADVGPDGLRIACSDLADRAETAGIVTTFLTSPQLSIMDPM